MTAVTGERRIENVAGHLELRKETSETIYSSMEGNFHILYYRK
jgi:hypothetical protein